VRGLSTPWQALAAKLRRKGRGRARGPPVRGRRTRHRAVVASRRTRSRRAALARRLRAPCPAGALSMPWQLGWSETRPICWQRMQSCGASWTRWAPRMEAPRKARRRCIRQAPHNQPRPPTMRCRCSQHRTPVGWGTQLMGSLRCSLCRARSHPVETTSSPWSLRAPWRIGTSRVRTCRCARRWTWRFSSACSV